MGDALAIVRGVKSRKLVGAATLLPPATLPGMKAIRCSTLRKALEFKRAGGLVLAVGALPEASDRLGRNDPEVAAMVGELFPKGVAGDVAAAIPIRDFRGPGSVLHRRVGQPEVYAVHRSCRA